MTYIQCHSTKKIEIDGKPRVVRCGLGDGHFHPKHSGAVEIKIIDCKERVIDVESEWEFGPDEKPADVRLAEQLALTEFWCHTCDGRHKPTREHPLCPAHRADKSPFDGHLHAPPPADLYFDHRGWRFTAPFVCMGCGEEVCYIQWEHQRGCCSTGHSQRQRLTNHLAFVGPHVRVPESERDSSDLRGDQLIDYARRDEFPVRPCGCNECVKRRHRVSPEMRRRIDNARG